MTTCTNFQGLEGWPQPLVAWILLVLGARAVLVHYASPTLYIPPIFEKPFRQRHSWTELWRQWLVDGVFNRFLCVCVRVSFSPCFFPSLILKRNMIGIGVFSSWSWPKSWRTCQETAFEPPFQDCRIEIEIDSDAATPDMSLGVAARGRQCGRLFPDCDNLKDPLFCAMWHRASKACNMFFFLRCKSSLRTSDTSVVLGYDSENIDVLFR